MNRIDVAEAFALMWQKSRHDAGKSQEYMAKALGVSRKTIQNWEDGTSCPNQMKGLEWFQVLGLQPLPYYLEVLYPSFDMTMTDSCKDIEVELNTIIHDLPDRSKKELLYILSGAHGSSAISVIEMLTAHLHSPLIDRVNIAQCVLTNYEISHAHDADVCKEQVQPDTEMLRLAISRGKESVLNRQTHYSTL